MVYVEKWDDIAKNKYEKKIDVKAFLKKLFIYLFRCILLGGGFSVK